MQKSELNNRIIYGAIAAAVAALALWIGGFVFFIFVLALSFIISREFDNLHKDETASFVFCIIPILLAPHPGVAALLVLGTMAFIFLLKILQKKPYDWLSISVAYICAPAIAFVWLRGTNPEWLVWLVLVVVATDIGAYFSGRKFGKRLMAPKISPKKTWEGLAGGAAAAAIVSFAYTQNITYTPYAIIFAALGQASDLMESAIKRHFGVKDTGTILPGHGGLMDRLDGFVLTAPLLTLMAYEGFFKW